MNDPRSFIRKEFERLCRTPSDINEHLPIFFKYATQSSSVVEFGVRKGVSTWAWLHGLLNNSSSERHLTGVDPFRHENIETINKLANTAEINYEFIQKSSLEITINPADILFIDSWHCYGQLIRELDKHHRQIKKAILIHDTSLFEHESEVSLMPFRWANPNKPENMEIVAKSEFEKYELERGLWPAVEDFLIDNPEWGIKERFTNCNGLTILQRLRDQP